MLGGVGGAGGGQIDLTAKVTLTAEIGDLAILLSMASVAQSASGDFWSCRDAHQEHT